MNAIIKHLKKANEREISELEESLRKAEEVKKLLSALRSPDSLTYGISLSSLWSDKGEEDVTLKAAGPVADIIKQAEEEFKKINRRSDVQADYSVSVVFDNGVQLSLPKELWKK